MELHEAIRRRSMVRSFAPDAVDDAVVETIVRAALRSPTAGNTRGTAWVVLRGADQTAAYWDSATDSTWQTTSPRADGLRRAPVILLAYASAAAYVARYAEGDKNDPALGTDSDNWTVPYWTGDAAFGVMAALLATVDADLGACVLGNFRGETAVARRLGVPDEWRLFCAVLVGRPDGGAHRSASLDRAGPSVTERIHWGSW